MESSTLDWTFLDLAAAALCEVGHVPTGIASKNSIDGKCMEQPPGATEARVHWRTVAVRSSEIQKHCSARTILARVIRGG